MCDTCPKSFCVECIKRNFGEKESKRVLELQIWSCYVCFSTEKMQKLQIDATTSLMNIDSVYLQIKPPKKNKNLSLNNIFLFEEIPEEMINELRNSEKRVLSFFTDQIQNTNPIFKQMNISVYLLAKDIKSLTRLSKNIRKTFEKIIVFPGLFKTSYGRKNNFKLFGELVI